MKQITIISRRSPAVKKIFRQIERKSRYATEVIYQSSIVDENTGAYIDGGKYTTARMLESLRIFRAMGDYEFRYELI